MRRNDGKSAEKRSHFSRHTRDRLPLYGASHSTSATSILLRTHLWLGTGTVFTPIVPLGNWPIKSVHRIFRHDSGRSCRGPLIIQRTFRILNLGMIWGERIRANGRLRAIISGFTEGHHGLAFWLCRYGLNACYVTFPQNITGNLLA